MIGGLILVLAAAPAGAQDPSFSEGFDDITTLTGDGWVETNNSSSAGSTSWLSVAKKTREAERFQGNDAVFPAHSGATTSYIAANFNSTATDIISDWLISPEVTFVDGDTITFYTRTGTASAYPDRLQVRLSAAGASTDVGTGTADVGDFTTLMLDINPTLTVGGYPETWTLQTATVTGFPTPQSGRFALRYYVTDAGPAGSNSNYIGVDTLDFTSSTPVELQSFSVE